MLVNTGRWTWTGFEAAVDRWKREQVWFKPCDWHWDLPHKWISL